MIYKFFKKYLSIIVLFSALLGSMHHHNDLQVHSDCKICIIHAKLINADTPTDTLYLRDIDCPSETLLTPFKYFYRVQKSTALHSRAPPLLS